MRRIKNKLYESIKGQMAVFLFTGNKTSTLIMSIIKGMDISAVFIETGFHFDEIRDYARTTFTEVEVIQNSKASADPEADMYECCSQRKRVALNEHLGSVSARCLIVPFRDDESASCIEDSYIADIDNIEILRPMAGLTEGDVWQKIKEEGLPFSSIYNKGYRVVDCKCCTTRHGRRKQGKEKKAADMDKDTEEKLKALGYM